MLVTNNVKMTWPHSVISQFETVDPNTMVETEWYAPYNTLLQHVSSTRMGLGWLPNIHYMSPGSPLTSPQSISWKGIDTWFSSLRSSHIPISSISPDALVQM